VSFTLESPRPRSDWYWALALSIAALALYVRTLCPTVYWYDSAEFAAAAALLGVPHPPGYPLYTLLGRVYVLLVPGEPAFAVNLMSAVHGAACVGLVFLLQRRLGSRRLAASCGALFFATGPSFWFNSSVAEVYTTGLVLGLATWLLLLDALAACSSRRLLLSGWLGGVGFAAHMFVATMGLGYLSLVIYGASRAAAQRARILAGTALCTLVGASLYLYVPLRLSMRPALRFVETSSLGSSLWMLSGGAYKSWFLVNYDRTGRAFRVLGLLAEQLSDLGFVLGVVGVLWLLVTRRMLGLALLLGIAGNLWFFFAYDVHDVEVFFLPSVALLSLGIGPLLTAASELLSGKALLRGLSHVTLGICLAYGVLRASLVLPTVDRSQDRSAEQYGEAVVAALPTGALVLSCALPEEWKYHAVFAYYFQKVLGRRPDVAMVTMPADVLEGLAAGRYAAGSEPAIIAQLRTTARPLYMYTRVAPLEPLFDFTPEGPLLRLRAKR